MIPDLVSVLQGPRTIPIILVLFLVYLVGSYIHAYWRLRHFKGPWLASFSYLWLASQVGKKRQGEVYQNVVSEYGSPLARIGPNDLVTDSPEVIRRMNGARSAYGRSSWYHTMKLDPTGDSMLSMMSTADHDRYKAKASLGYAGKETPTMEASIDEQLRLLGQLIRTKYLSDESPGQFRPFDFATAIQYFTLDAITSVAYGQAFGFLTSDSDVHDYIKIVEQTIPGIALSAEVPAFQKIFLSKWFLTLLGPKPTDTKGIGKIMGVARAVVAQRFSREDKPQTDMLGSFIRHGLTQEECEQEVMLQIIAGSDTTATALRGTMLLLCSTPHAYYKLQREIDEALATGKVSSPISVEAAKTLPYLQAVIYEGLRLNPPFTGPQMKEVPPGGDTIDGQFVPGGVRIGIAVRGVQRRKDLYGEDPDIFRPERWIEVSPETRLRMQAATELVFGYGRWMCAGKPVAFMELNKAYFELLRQFDFQIVNPKKPWREANVNIFFQSNLWMKVTDRKATSH